MKRACPSDEESGCSCSSNNNNIIMTSNHKIFNDSVHGIMKFHPLCVAIIDTPQFQRLRNIKQLGKTYLVYPAACHNRFEHSLGVSYLGGLMVDALVQNTPGLVISPEEKLSVEIAGLCHDLGHAPFSHAWEVFLKRYNIHWMHEDGSEQVLDYMIEDNNLQKLFDLYKVNVNLIKELIQGKGTILSKNKSYLYQIIANKENDIDVDKWDYFIRDGHQLNLKITFDHKRIMSFCTVLADPSRDGRPYIAYRNKEATTIFDMFRVRADLHLRAYQHVAVKNIELMLIDALVAANDFYKVTVDNKSYKLNEAHTNVKALCKLTDHIQYVIEYSDDPQLGPAKEILNRINTRNLYHLVFTHNIQAKSDFNPSELQSELEKLVAPLQIIVIVANINLGSCGNPFKNIVFYKKPVSDKLEIDTTVSVEGVFSYFPFKIEDKTCMKDVRVFCKENPTQDQREKMDGFLKQYFHISKPTSVDYNGR